MLATKNAFVLFAQFDVCVGYTLLPGRGRAVLVTSYIWQVADLITTLRGLGYRIFNSRTGDLVTSFYIRFCRSDNTGDRQVR